MAGSGSECWSGYSAGPGKKDKCLTVPGGTGEERDTRASQYNQSVSSIISAAQSLSSQFYFL